MVKMKKILLSFLLILTLICNCPCVTYASGSLSGWDTWTNEQKATWWTANIAQIVGSSIGLFMPNNQVDIFTAVCSSMYDELMKDTSDESYNDWLSRHLGYDADTQEVTMDDELTDFVYNASVQYIEENTGWYNCLTFQMEDFYNIFHSKAQYDYVENIINNLSLNQHAVIRVHGSGQSVKTTNSEGAQVNVKGTCLLYVYDTDGLLYDYGAQASLLYGWEYAHQSTSNTKEIYCIDMQGNDISQDFKNYSTNLAEQYLLHSGNLAYVPCLDTQSTIAQYGVYLVKDTRQTVRAYKTLDEYKAYSIGQRSCYMTDKFINYDSTVDNSTTITQTEIDNSVTYGDVYNYITNNYDNPDGLSEDELRAILAEYLSQINNNNSGGGSGGSGDSGGSGGGLGGFLDGLGSVGNAILAILGKLMEILGSAIELVTGAITDLITIIPNSIGELLGALFPVFPEEWIKAITLSLVLGVVVGIVRMFK